MELMGAVEEGAILSVGVFGPYNEGTFWSETSKRGKKALSELTEGKAKEDCRQIHGCLRMTSFGGRLRLESVAKNVNDFSYDKTQLY